MIDKYCLYIYSLHSVQRDIYIHTIEGRKGIEPFERTDCAPLNLCRTVRVYTHLALALRCWLEGRRGLEHLGRTDCAPLKVVGV